MLAMFSETVWLLDNVTVFGSLVVPTVCAAKVRLTGENHTVFTPVPDTSYSRGLIAPLFATEMLPSSNPFAGGVNVT
jgi:hypothetical protein